MRAAALLSLTLAGPVEAQTGDDRGAHASFTAGGSFGEGKTAPALSAAMRVAFSDRIGMEFELAYARNLDFTLDLCPAPLVCVRGGRLPVTGRTVSLIPHLTIDLLPSLRWLRVYAQAGVGAGHVRQRYMDSSPGGTGEGVEHTRSSLTAAVSFGGGVTVAISRQLAVGADLRSLHLLDDPPQPGRQLTPSSTLSTLRVGSRVSYKF